MNRDGARKSIWQEEIKKFSLEPVLEKHYDVAIVGAGITGISAAIRLQKEGQKCIVLEAANIGFGTTGGTTAHLNDFFDTTYAQAIKDFGLNSAKLLKYVGIEAKNIIRNNIREFNIDCDFENKTAYLFALDEKQEKQLEDMVKGASQVGHQMTFTNEIPFPFAFRKAAVIPNQGQFHPIKYIKSLAEAFINLGGTLVEDCVCEGHDEQENSVILKSSKGSISANHVIYATHIPPGVSILHLMNAPYRSYAIAFSLKGDHYPKDLGYDLTDPYHYYRIQNINGEDLLIAGGEDHKTGHTEDTGECFSKLENYVREHFDVDTAVYSWSSQYYEPTDGFPYIGILPGCKKIYTATGFRGNGMIFGTIASQILGDLILTGSSKYKELFDPGRIKPVAGFTNFVKEQASVVLDFVKDKLFIEKINSLTELTEGEAKVVKYEGESYAVYKDSGGKIHLVKSTCTHMNCEVRWNSAEISWDCPCHGSRFNVNGKMLTGPTVKDLHRIEL
ncbi:FAD-dependent oxidoreductase [Chryseobacterium lathyri]|jgi:glycine/D-amino acid oxidase-like deaminating enzyme/nitrite reductase/ring-hydroxylating ferredoxin subunit|uniref:FAD-dependent oxidoreductase n=1 Tax=Chryseobacterium TaxID=59732 RepID=UPI001CC15D8D|nr:FAD-dependent oxidoreductase [Chryseobacterium lathyri]